MPEPPAPPPAPDLAAIAACAAAATPGPWVLHGKRADYEGDFVWAVHDQSADNPYHPVAEQLTEGYGILSVCHVAASEQWEQDRVFIAAARQDVPALVAYARALEAENARLRAGLVEMRGLSMHGEWCWSESVRVDIDRLLRGETLPGQEL